jgi:hypothetical protein
MDGDIGLTGFSDQSVTLGTRPECVGLLTHFSSPRREAILKGDLLLETTPLEHGALLSVKGRLGAQLAFSPQISAEVRSVVRGVCACLPLGNSAQVHTVKDS